MCIKFNTQTRKALFWTLLAGIVLVLCFGASGSTAARAKTAGTATPTATPYTVSFLATGSSNLTQGARDAIVLAMKAWPNAAPENNTFFLIGLSWHSTWAIATLTSANLNAPLPAGAESWLNFGNLISLLLVNTTSGWRAAIDVDTNNLQSLLALVPLSEFGLPARNAVFPAPSLARSQSAASSQAYTNYKFPWPATYGWVLTQGWHDGASYGFPANYGLDFDIQVVNGNSDILASADGKVTMTCDISGATNGLVVITTEGERLGYLHLDRATITVVIGDTVSQGQKLGRMVDSDDADVIDGCGSSYGTHIHIYAPAKPFTIDGVTFPATGTLPTGPFHSTQGSSCYTLTTSANPSAGGTVNASPAPNCNGTQYTSGTVVTLTATPNYNSYYDIYSWSDGSCGTSLYCSVTITSSKTVTAKFKHYVVNWNQAPWSAPMDKTALPGGINGGDIQSLGGFVIGNTLTQGLWQGGLGYSRTVPISVDGKVQWPPATAPGWSAPMDKTALPGGINGGDIQAQAEYVIGNTLIQGIWQGGLGYSRTVPISVEGKVQWPPATAPGWSAPMDKTTLPGGINGGDIQSLGGFVIGHTLVQGLWQGGWGYTKTVPISVDGVVRWSQGSPWSAPMNIIALPGSGVVQAQAEYVVGNTIIQGIWQGGRGYSRTVPITIEIP